MWDTRFWGHVVAGHAVFGDTRLWGHVVFGARGCGARGILRHFPRPVMGNRRGYLCDDLDNAAVGAGDFSQGRVDVVEIQHFDLVVAQIQLLEYILN